MTEAMKRTVISGTPRQNSMKVIENILTIGSLERRPSARRMPRGSDTAMPVTAMTRVTRRPPQSACLDEGKAEIDAGDEQDHRDARHDPGNGDERRARIALRAAHERIGDRP